MGCEGWFWGQVPCRHSRSDFTQGLYTHVSIAGVTLHTAGVTLHTAGVTLHKELWWYRERREAASSFGALKRDKGLPGAKVPNLDDSV